MMNLSMFHIWSQNEVQAFWVDHNSDGVYHRLMQNCWLQNECQLELKSHDNHGRICMKFLVFQKMQMKLPSKRPVIGMAMWVQAGWLDHDRWCRYPNAQINNWFLWSPRNRNEKDCFNNGFWRNQFKMACSRKVIDFLMFNLVSAKLLLLFWGFWRDPSPLHLRPQCNKNNMNQTHHGELKGKLNQSLGKLKLHQSLGIARTSKC